MNTVEGVNKEVRRTYENHTNFQLDTLPKQLLRKGWIKTHVDMYAKPLETKVYKKRKKKE